MQYHEFIGHVQHRTRLATEQDALRAIRATLPGDFARLFEAGSEGRMPGR